MGTPEHLIQMFKSASLEAANEGEGGKKLTYQPMLDTVNTLLIHCINQCWIQPMYFTNQCSTYQPIQICSLVVQSCTAAATGALWSNRDMEDWRFYHFAQPQIKLN